LNFNNSKKAIGSLKIINQFPVVPFQGRFICPGLFLEKVIRKKKMGKIVSGLLHRKCYMWLKKKGKNALRCSFSLPLFQ
jgi:hypothetical protein